MKKILILGLLICSFAMVNAQRATLMPLVAGDTIVNTGTVAKIFTATAGYSGAAVQVVLSKISGTGAGTVQLYGSLDGTNYTAIGSAYTITDVATQSQVFYVTAPLAVYIKVLATGSGTESVKMRTYYVERKYSN